MLAIGPVVGADLGLGAVGAGHDQIDADRGALGVRLDDVGRLDDVAAGDLVAVEQAAARHLDARRAPARPWSCPCPSSGPRPGRRSGCRGSAASPGCPGRSRPRPIRRAGRSGRRRVSGRPAPGPGRDPASTRVTLRALPLPEPSAQPLPEDSDTSRSEDSPPIRTATCISDRGRDMEDSGVRSARLQGAADPLDLPFELHAESWPCTSARTASPRPSRSAAVASPVLIRKLECSSREHAPPPYGACRASRPRRPASRTNGRAGS